MKTSVLIIIIISVTVLLMGTIGIQESFADQIQVKLGETISYDDLKIYFYDVEDSRCPLDVTCIWEGKVSAMIRYINATHKIGGPQELNLPIEYGRYSFVLRDVSPHPTSTEKPDYVVTLQINKTKSVGEFIDERCGSNTISIDRVCQVVPVNTVGDDASFFGFFVYLDNLISWIFGK